MADSSFLSDSDDEDAVQELLSEAIDETVLDQVAKINCSGFSDSVLPNHLETRFQKLKSFPSSRSNPRFSSTHIHSAFSSSFVLKNSNNDKFESSIFSCEENDDEDEKAKHEYSSKLEENLSGKSRIMVNSKSSAGGRGLKSLRDDEICFHCKKIPDDTVFHTSVESSPMQAPEGLKLGKLKFPDGINKKLKMNSPCVTSSNSSNSSSDSSSPPARSSCFWCYPRKASRKRSRKKSILETSLDCGTNDDILLSGLSNLSVQSQQKLLKKAMKEEEKINREAEKIVKWAKQVSSARIETSSIEDYELSD